LVEPVAPTPILEPIEPNINIEFIKYPTVTEMLLEAGDFGGEDGSLKIISNNPLHVQVSKSIFDGDIEKVIVEQTKRDIIYVVFQAFAQTDVDKLIVSSVPRQHETGAYINRYRLQRNVKRKAAQDILLKYLSTSDFKVLFALNGTIWVPSDKFDLLKFKYLDQVYKDCER
jgi:hypothetical protein